MRQPVLTVRSNRAKQQSCWRVKIGEQSLASEDYAAWLRGSPRNKRMIAAAKERIEVQR